MPEEEVNASTPRSEAQGLPSTRAQAEGLRVDPERRFFTPPSKAGLGAGERVKEEQPPEEPLSVLLNRLDRTYKRIRRKLKREKKKGEDVSHPGWWRQLEEAQQTLEALEKEME